MTRGVAAAPDSLHEIAHFAEVRFGEPGQPVRDHFMRTSGAGHDRRAASVAGCPTKSVPSCTDNFRADIVAVFGVHEGFDVADGAGGELQIDHAGVEGVYLFEFGDRDG